MGAQACSEPTVAETKDTVRLNIYDVSGTRVVEEANKLFRPLGTGAFHAAVEVFGKEYSFGFCEKGSGVFTCQPKNCSMHKYRESINLGDTDVTEEEFNTSVEKLQNEWQGLDYDLLCHNCCHFSKAMAEALRVTDVPAWVTNLAGAGATLNKGIKEACVKGGEVVDKAQAQAIIAAAKAGKIDEQYKIRGKVQAKAEELLIKAGEIQEKYELQKHAENLANEVQGHANRIGSQLAGIFSQASSPQSTSPAK